MDEKKKKRKNGRLFKSAGRKEEARAQSFLPQKESSKSALVRVMGMMQGICSFSKPKFTKSLI